MPSKPINSVVADYGIFRSGDFQGKLSNEFEVETTLKTLLERITNILKFNFKYAFFNKCLVSLFFPP